MRLALDARAIGPHFPGIGRATLGLLRGLHEIDHDEQILVIHQPSERELLEPTGVTNDPRFRLVGIAAAPLGLDQQWRLPLVARRARLALWHAPYYFRPFWGLPRTIVTIADIIGRGGDWATREVLGAQGTWRGRLLWEIATRLSLRSAKHVITHSESSRTALQAAYHLPNDAISVIPHGTDAHFYPQSPERIQAVHQRYDLPRRYVLYLGSNKPHKNLHTLVEAWSMVLRDEDNTSDDLALVIAGRQDPRYRAAEQKVDALGLQQRVRFLPNVVDIDVPAMLSGATVFVFPSLYEGFGLPPLEAMACGAPALVSNRTSLPEVVGDAGLLIDPTAEALADGMRRLLQDETLRQQLRERGLQRAAQFSWRRTATETLRVYHEVATRNRE